MRCYVIFYILRRHSLEFLKRITYRILNNGINYNAVQLQKGKNTAIAMFPNNMLASANKKFINHKDQLEAGSKLLLYTDGLVETCPVDSDTFFEYANMEQVFLDNHKYPC